MGMIGVFQQRYKLRNRGGRRLVNLSIEFLANVSGWLTKILNPRCSLPKAARIQRKVKKKVREI
jgi:hypothetical protein